MGGAVCDGGATITDRESVIEIYPNTRISPLAESEDFVQGGLKAYGRYAAQLAFKIMERK